MVRRNTRQNRNRRSNNGSRRRRNNTRNSLLKTSVVNITPTPRSSSLTVWNSYLIQRSFTCANDSKANITTGYLYDSLIDRLALTGSPVIDVRVMSIEVYDLAGRPIALNLYDLDTEVSSSSNVSTSMLKTGFDYPGRNSWARVKLVYPRVITANPITIATGYTSVMATVQVGSPMGIANTKSTSVLLRIKLLWQSNGPAKVGHPNLFVTDSMTPEGVLNVDSDNVEGLEHSDIRSDLDSLPSI